MSTRRYCDTCTTEITGHHVTVKPGTKLTSVWAEFLSGGGQLDMCGDCWVAAYAQLTTRQETNDA